MPPDARNVLGPPDARITLIEYGDLECPYCRDAAPVLRELVAGAAGQVRLVWRHFPLFEVHPYALTAALAAEAAGAHGLFWPMQELMFARQDRLTNADLRGYADELGIDPDEVVGERAQQHADAVESDYLGGVAAGVRGTPTLLVDGVRHRGPIELAALRAALGVA